MSKKEYLDELETILQNHNVSDDDINDILSDYSEMYDEGINKELSDTEIRKLLGEPRRVYEDLKDTVSFIIKKTKKDHKFVALSPFLALIIFIGVGMGTGVWHPTWLAFLLIPVAGILSDGIKRTTFVALSPFIALISFIIITYFYQAYEYAWLIFLIVPILGLLSKRTAKNMLTLISFVLAIAFYLYMTIAHDQMFIGLFGFLLPMVAGLTFSKIIVIKNWDFSKRGLTILLFTLLWLTVFILMGLYIPGGWAYCWQVLLLIPITSIIFSRHFRLISIMPFIATIIFYSTGYFFGMFEISWLAFLLIPMVAILDDEKVVEVKHK